MAYDRYDTRDGPRDRSSRWSGDRPEGRHPSQREDRGFFERAGDEIASWFGNEEDDRGDGRERMGRDRDRSFGRDPRERDDHRGRESYRPVTGDYGRSEQFFAAGGTAGRGFDRSDERSDHERSQSPWGRDEYRRTSFAGSSDRSREFDPHYQSWRDRQVEALDRDYQDYRRENQSRFEDDFANWREQRQSKRQMLGSVREHMEVVGSDEKHVGTIDRVAGDRLILTKSDPDAGGAHHSLSCSEIDRIEGDRVLLGVSAEQAKQRWRDESRGRALFEREDQGRAGPHILDRSFEGTYR